MQEPTGKQPPETSWCLVIVRSPLSLLSLLSLPPLTPHLTPTHPHTHTQALDKLEKINKPDVTATEASECSTLSTEEQQLLCVAEEVDVMIRTAFVEFLFNPEILGCVDQSLCIFRLFPRPVVSLRPSTFMTTYQKNSPTTDTNFIRDLIRSQVLLLCVEYHFSWGEHPLLRAL